MDIFGLIALAKVQSGGINKVFHFKGVKSTINLLPIQGEEGDVYKVEENNSYYAWDGEGWTDIGQILTADDAAELFDQLEDVGDQQVVRIQQKGEQTLASIPADYTALSGEVDDLKSAINNVVNSYTILQPYLYKRNTWINTSMAEVEKTGYDLYKIPLNNNDILLLEWDGSIVDSNLAYGNAWRGLFSDNSYAALLVSNGQTNQMIKSPETSTGNFALFVGSLTFKALMLCIKRGVEENLKISLNEIYPTIKEPVPTFIHELNQTNTIMCKAGLTSDNVFGNLSALNTVYGQFLKVKQGDRIEFTGELSVYSTAGSFRDNAGSLTSISKNAGSFTAPSDGMLIMYVNTDSTRRYTYYPSNSVKIEGKYIVNPITDEQYKELSGVAFGTSLTYRAQTTGGYMQYLPDLSGITFENQGVGSSYIYGTSGSLNMLETIKSYEDYSAKRIVTVEGFVNDWFQEHTLGSYTDNTEDSVCGCVRSALDYIRTQNANATVFLILDNYGRNLPGDANCSSTSIRGGKTQYEYYEEIAKVANSMGIHVIKLYEISEISEYTPQYFIDSIHPNALGAKQAANAIWNYMRQFYPNAIS